MTQKTLAKHLDEYTALAQQIAALEAQKQAVADKIKDAMGEAEEVAGRRLYSPLQGRYKQPL